MSNRNKKTASRSNRSVRSARPDSPPGPSRPTPEHSFSLAGEMKKLLQKVCGLVGTFTLFILVGLVSFQLQGYIHWLEGQGAGATLIAMLEYADNAITAVDLLGLVNSVWKHIRD